MVPVWGRGLQEDEGQVEVERVVSEEEVVQHDMEEDEEVGGHNGLDEDFEARRLYKTGEAVSLVFAVWGRVLQEGARQVEVGGVAEEEKLEEVTEVEVVYDLEEFDDVEKQLTGTGGTGESVSLVVLVWGRGLQEGAGQVGVRGEEEEAAGVFLF